MSTSSSVEIEGTCVSKNLGETVRLQSEKRQSGYERKEERDYQGLQKRQVALSVWPAHQLRHSPRETSVWGPIVV